MAGGPSGGPSGGPPMVMPAASEPALCVRERKCALLEVIELQRKLIEQREDSEELEWYAEQTKRLERFKLALNSLRLQPDEFALRVPCEWMPGSRTSARSRGMAECKLRVNSRSQMAFVPADATAQPSGDPAVSADASGEPSEDAEACRPRVFFIDELRVIRTEPQPEGDAPTLVLSWRRVEDRSECSLRCVAPEAIEVSEVLVHALKSTAYDCANEGHEQLLRRLWQCGFPGVELTQRVTADWIRIGFQGPDPATDFRGMGVLGLQNLVYFGEHYPDVFARLVTAQRKRDYPLACAGINVTFMLLELLQLKDAPPDEVQRRPPVAEAWDTDLFRFFCHMFYRERPFEDMYCFSLRMLDRIFVSLDADYADFPSVLAVLRTRIQEALAQRPLSFREFKRCVSRGAENPSDTRSSHSHDAPGVTAPHVDAEGLAQLLGGALPRGLEAVKSLGSSVADWSSTVLGGRPGEKAR